MSKASGLADISVTWGASSDASPRPTRLAGIENDTVEKLEALDDLLGAGVEGAFSSVAERLDSFTASTALYKQPVRVATKANITLSGTQTIDGVTVQVGDRVLVNAQTTASQNGVYVVASGAWARAADFDTGGEFPGSMVLVLEGDSGAGQVFAVQNATAPTIGTTNITFQRPARGPAEFWVAAWDCPSARRSADYICDGTADDFELDVVLFILSISTFGRGVIHLSAGTFNFSGPVVPISGMTIEGAGPNATIINRTANIIPFDISGTYTGGGSIAGHKHGVTLRDLRIVGSVSPDTNPMVRVYYGNHHRFERVIFDGGASVGLLALEWQDSVVEQCSFLACGSKGLGARTFGATGTGSGGRPAVLVLGDTQTSGTGHTDLGCTGLRFNNCTFDNITDGAVLVHGNTANEDFAGQVVAQCTRLWFTNNKVKSLATGYAPQLYFHRVLNGYVHNNHVLAGDYLSGAGTPEDVVSFDTCSILTVTGLQVETQTAQHRTLVRFNGCEAVDCGPVLVDDAAPSAPSVALVQLAGSNTYWVRQPKVQVRFRNAHTDASLVSGTTTSCLENRGTATIAVGTTSVVVTHGLPHTPTAGDILLTATSNPANDPGHIWWDTATATQFTINCKAAPTTTALVVAWRAEQLADQGHT